LDEKLKTNSNFKNKAKHTFEEFERAPNKSIIIIMEEERLKNMDVLLFYEKKWKYLNCELIYYFPKFFTKYKICNTTKYNKKRQIEKVKEKLLHTCESNDIILLA